MTRFLVSFASLIWKYTRPKTAVVATTVTKTNARATRTAEDLKNSSICVQHEARSADIGDQRRKTPRIDLFPQIADVDIDDVGLEREVVLPHFLQQHRAGDYLAGMPQKVFEQLELARQQIDLGVPAMHRLFDQVHFKIAYPQLRGSHIVETAQQRLDSRGELGHRKRLGEIIVASRLQATDLLVDGGQCRDHQHRDLYALLAQHFQSLQAVFAEHHPVHDQQGGIAD